MATSARPCASATIGARSDSTPVPPPSTVAPLSRRSVPLRVLKPSDALASLLRAIKRLPLASSTSPAAVRVTPTSPSPSARSSAPSPNTMRPPSAAIEMVCATKAVPPANCKSCPSPRTRRSRLRAKFKGVDASCSASAPRSRLVPVSTIRLPLRPALAATALIELPSSTAPSGARKLTLPALPSAIASARNWLPACSCTEPRSLRNSMLPAARSMGTPSICLCTPATSIKAEAPSCRSPSVACNKTRPAGSAIRPVWLMLAPNRSSLPPALATGCCTAPIPAGSCVGACAAKMLS